jgi:hypothetical protein
VAFNTGQFHLVSKTLFSILVINTIGINSFWSIVNACKVGQKKNTIQKSKKYKDIKEKFAYFSTLIKSQKLQDKDQKTLISMLDQKNELQMNTEVRYKPEGSLHFLFQKSII